MKAAFALAALLLAMQQQTFYSAKAQPKPVPAHTAQAINPGYIYYANCASGGRGGKSGSSQAGHSSRTSRGTSNCSGSRRRRSTTKPAPRHS